MNRTDNAPMTTNTEIRLWEAYFEQLPEFVEVREHRTRLFKRALLTALGAMPFAAALVWFLN